MFPNQSTTIYAITQKYEKRTLIKKIKLGKSDFTGGLGHSSEWITVYNPK